MTAVASRKTGGDGILLTKTHVKFGGDSDDEYEEVPKANSEVVNQKEEEEVPIEVPRQTEEEVQPAARASAMSDMDYLRSKMKFHESKIAVDESAENEGQDEEDIEDMQDIEDAKLNTTGKPKEHSAESEAPAPARVQVEKKKSSLFPEEDRAPQKTRYKSGLSDRG